MKLLIEWLDDFAFNNSGIMLLFDIAMISVAVVCTLINARVLLL